ncbi:MAG: hypothetical protein KDC24_00630 [Saprospiraceae bacterium]|nr:hypothetical protein [Saprospiraceae bacterium]
MKYLLPAILAFFPSIILCQLPSTQIYYFELEPHGASELQLTKPRYLTAYNEGGYNNQPNFFTPYDLYFTQQGAGDTLQTDIFKLDLVRKVKYRVTATLDQEYSPTLMPDKLNFSVVRVEPGGLQRLWSLPRNQQGKGYPIFKDLTTVGYHCWLEPDLVALFMVGEPHYLIVAKPSDGSQVKVASNIGRCLKKLPNGNLAYVQKATESTWYIKEYKLLTGTSEIVMKTLPGSEDFTILDDGTFLMALGGTIFKKHPAIDDTWSPVANLENFGLKNIQRLSSFGEKYLAVVNVN